MARKVYSDEVKARAVLLGLEYGPAEAGRRTGVAKGTIASWMSRAGVATIAPETTRAAVEMVQANTEQRKAALAEQMLLIAEKAAEQELAKLADAPLFQVVGSRTRAIHDLQLLTGAATARTEQMTPEDAHAVVDKLAERRTA